MSETIFTKIVLSVVQKGSSRPIKAVDSTGETVFIKLNGGLSSPSAAISDWIARIVAIKIDLPVVRPVLIQLDERADAALVDTEVRDLLRKSTGLNSCSPYFQDVLDVNLPTSLLSAQLQERLFLFDMFLLNVDRTFSNPNIITADSAIYSIDYEASFLIMGALNGKQYHDAQSVQNALRQNPLYHAGITAETIRIELEKLRTIDWKNVVNTLPDIWLEQFSTSVDVVRNRLADVLAGHTANVEQYLQFYKNLATIAFVSDTERKRKNLENRNNFTSKYSL